MLKHKPLPIIIFLLLIYSTAFTQTINCKKILKKHFKEHFKIDQPKEDEAFLIEAEYVYEYNTEVTRDSIETDTIVSEVVVAKDYYRQKNRKTETYYDGKEAFLVTPHDTFPAIIKLNRQQFLSHDYRQGFESFIEFNTLMKKYGDVSCIETDTNYIANIDFKGEVLLLTGGIGTFQFYIDKESKEVQPYTTAIDIFPKSTTKKVHLAYHITPLDAKEVKAQSARSFIYNKDGSLKDEYKKYMILGE
jgi:hypothetical protein